MGGKYQLRIIEIGFRIMKHTLSKNAQVWDVNCRATHQ